MIVHLISPTSTKKIDAEWIEVSTDQGSFVIQKGHAPMLLVIAKDKPLIYQLSDGKTETINASRGIVEVTRKEVRVLLVFG